MFNKEVLKIVKRLQEARLSLMKKQPFYAVLLLHMQFSLDPMCETAYTDGQRIAFGPDFIETLTDEELQFVLMHEVLHAALNHCNRKPDAYDFDDYNTACDIVVNSNILYSCNMDRSKITLNNYGESMHLAPDKKEGYECSVEEVYKLVHAKNEKAKKTGRTESSSKGKANKKQNRKETEGDKEESKENKNIDEVALARSDGGFDDHTYWDGDEAESYGSGSEGSEEGPETDNDELRDSWLQRMIEATQIAEQISVNQSEHNCGPIPLGVQRIVKELTDPQTDWRTVLDMFIQEEVTDYSFNPPDRRFQDSSFLLPDYNEKDERVKDILFMIDTSGSMSDVMITQAYSEIYGAIQQFNGNLHGWLGFFDASVIEPKEFMDEEELKIIRPKGGGGTSFRCIFEYVREHIDVINPASIIILTDGYAPWPNEDAAMNIPVLWLINNEKVQPPWGKVTRIKVDGKGRDE